jgi:hypothetical protein
LPQNSRSPSNVVGYHPTELVNVITPTNLNKALLMLLLATDPMLLLSIETRLKYKCCFCHPTTGLINVVVANRQQDLSMLSLPHNNRAFQVCCCHQTTGLINVVVPTQQQGLSMLLLPPNNRAFQCCC